ncbi:putative cardiolipin-specific deacylase, mitochondrial [Cyberlindnera fabianii]|uniref:Putative cardiolipin-specific deacylase, mitochondrial n=1 Tax=Cyberlindnera fabianii TaxID=36022 RepID=A0A1V2L4S2_CYBFA|nr:putative cardiolipin-specific deacylase, mitochondrial [Cyberlindnera fabianii]
MSKVKEDKLEYGFIQGLKHWWSRGNLAKAENEILSGLPFYPETDHKRIAEIKNVSISKSQYIHEFNVRNIETSKKEDEKHVVLVHGYGAALGLFIRNFEGLTEKPGVNLHALDLLGYGLSSRPKLPKQRGSTLEDVHNVEGFFIDSMEKWREESKIEKFNLIGHSFGGYLSALYALKYPQHVEKLVLVSPVGVERSQFDLSSPHSTTTKAEVQGPDIEQEIGLHNKKTDEPVEKSSSLHVPDENGYVDRVPNLPWLMDLMWKRNMSPFTLIRGLGPWGASMATNWSFRRFAFLEDHEMILKMHVYCYGTFAGKGSGEYALTRVLAPGALAKHPLLSRVPGNLKMPSLWMYGDVDWMSKEAGKFMTKKINETATPETKAEYKVVSGAGHHLYLDNPDEFNDDVYKFFGW